MIRITVYAGIGPSDDEDAPYQASVHERGEFSERDVSEELRKLGLEWRQADYFQTRQTLIVLDPVDPRAQDKTELRAKVREAASALEETGLL